MWVARFYKACASCEAGGGAKNCVFSQQIPSLQNGGSERFRFDPQRGQKKNLDQPNQPQLLSIGSKSQTMLPFQKNLFWCLLIALISQSCFKEIESGSLIRVSGSVKDPVKNKTLPLAKLYLYGAKSTFYGISYTQGPLDSVVANAQGNFSIAFQAEGISVDYGLSLDNGKGSPQGRYVVDRSNDMFEFNFQKQISNAVVSGRELNFSRLSIKVDNNPFDTLYVSTQSHPIQTQYVVGKQVAATLNFTHLPNAENQFQIYVASARDTIGLYESNRNIPAGGRFFYPHRSLTFTYQADLSDTIRLNKSIGNLLDIPRSTTCCR